ncbi:MULTISPECIES: glycosyltransferase family 4 protein [unclassified Sulfurospirillum]|uniref:MraY family glycosyltransferase n=1 Tax=unclassified Sulfurospirillum TaxID=2618290 RepID=UPI0005081735|nr:MULTISPECIES: glycosyltransferase family 4 protein [unclassified Sulfurospirillum]KFL34046.1 glycosyl transferase [Sulfurospirillum sp. SCADC]
MIYGILFLMSLALTYLVRIIALKKSLLVIPNERSSHSSPTPHGGGIAIAISWFLGLMYLFTCNKIEASLFYALMAGSALCVVSFLDDIYELSPKVRLFVQASVALFGLYMLGGLSQIDSGIFILENQFFTNTFAFLGIMWCINLYNFLDGIDGYAGSEAIFLGTAGWLLFGGDHFLVLVASVAGFLVWNWHKAKIFMGDVGSTLLGYTIAIFALYYQNKGVSIFIWLILFGLFWFDATLTLYRRYKNGERLSQAHRKHAYQRLVQSGLGHDSVVYFALSINLVLLILGYSASIQPSNTMGYFMVAFLILYGAMKMVDKRKKFA